MRVVTFRHETEERLGFLVDDQVVDPKRVADQAGEAAYDNAIAFIRAGEETRRAADRLIADAPPAARLALAEVTLAAPMRPSTLLCSGSNYRDHNREKANTPISGKEPEFFVKTADSVVGPGEPIVYDPALTRKLDCETELAVVIGKPGRHIPVASALEHVFGYTIVNDVTARDRQVRTSAEGTVWYDLGRGKSFDSSAPLGPCIVTTDEIPDPQHLKLETRINGELRQLSTTADMIWTCAELIHFFSTSFTLRPGMVIITGTPAGTAWSTDPELGGKWQALPGLVPASRYCLPGDRIESTIEKIGVLRNDVVHV
jgi:2-keto-4-pentenoate hydratase/2-oxohepta-3-ene-1,7-dioic acid hydratase in catechol pathway